MAKTAAAVNPAPVPLTSCKRYCIDITKVNGPAILDKDMQWVLSERHTFVRRYVAQDANAEKTGAVKTQTVSTDRGMFKEFSILHLGMHLNASDVMKMASRLS